MIKKLDLYVLRSFVSTLFATFFICLFVLLMQFLWKYVDEMIGKGLALSVIAEFFFYSALTLVPMALPLAILLASLMAFGNMGERLELLAMKAAGISLFRIMRPLIVGISFVCVGAFFFSNNVIPIAQVKLWTLIYSMRDTSPEIEIPENVFYSGISGYSIFVKKKDTNRNLLKDVMIYDLSKGFENITVTVADSARLQFTEDKNFLILTLYSGESFENLKSQETRNENIPYRRESFVEKQTLIEFDGNFTKVSESIMKDKYTAKNIVRLGNDIDSFRVLVDSLSLLLKEQMLREYISATNPVQLGIDTAVLSGNFNADSLFATLRTIEKKNAVSRAIRDMSASINEVSYRKYEIEDRAYLQRRHLIEWHRKFSLSFACLIFFFIGAPLGAIIRKGGLGFPIVISVFLFIAYYIIDNTGYKFAREGVWEVFAGMWLSASVLLSLGIFLTYKAATDSDLLNADAWNKFFGKYFKKKNSVKENEPYDYVSELYKSFLKNSNIALVLYGILILLFASLQSISTDSVILIVLLIVLYLGIFISYFVFLIKSFLTEDQFYKEIGEKPRDTTAFILFTIFGAPFYFFIYFYFQNKMKEKMKEIEYEKKRRAIYINKRDNQNINQSSDDETK